MNEIKKREQRILHHFNRLGGRRGLKIGHASGKLLAMPLSTLFLVRTIHDLQN